MVRASQPKSLQLDLAERPQPVHQARTSFVWSHAKIRIASLVLATVATPAAAAFAAPAPFVKWLCLVWLCGIAVLMQGLSRRVNDGAVVLSVDRRGILDHRLISRHIAWQEIKTIWRPRLVLTPESSPSVQASLASDVLGSLLFKTPRCGEAWSERAGSWQVRFALDGVFDQSFMLRPDLAQRQWELDFSAAPQNRSLSPKAIAEWLGSRFDR